ncbi:suppressor of fused domain protein [Fertoebacter nigrum]|uniref:Suppressor of fused domain protein n=1 Tax=Fertoeibacter niger TaxID=2656921 RepID=A0A8X8GZY3_9RHOB|nr:suppressor of fused domain protein [Fertoeibacter niger]NUB44380.1 suppressor of fused domain protein [Fertoeibacter niger]
MSLGRNLLAGILSVVAAKPATAQDVPSAGGDGERLYKLVEARLTAHFGTAPHVMHEIVSDKVHLDLLPFAPRPGQDFWVISTIGMSFVEMSVPPHVENGWFWKRAELMIALPADWPVPLSSEDLAAAEDSFHPLATLKRTARYPHLAETAIAPMQTVDFGEPLGPDTRMTAVLIWWPDFLPADAATIKIGPDQVVNLYQVIPIHPDEREFAISAGSPALYDLLKSAGAVHLYDLHRKSVVSGS